MKIFILNLLLLLPVSSLMAQDAEIEIIPKNYVGINFAGMYSTNEVSANKQTQLMLNGAPFYGRRVKRFVFGLGVGAGYNYNKVPYNSYNGLKSNYATEKSTELLLSPTIRYYTKLNLFLTGSFNIGKGIGESSTPVISGRDVYYYNVDNTSNIIGGSLGMGYAIKAGKSFLIEPQILIQKTFNEIYYETYTSLPSIFFNNYNYKVKRDYLNVLIGLGTIYRF